MATNSPPPDDPAAPDTVVGALADQTSAKSLPRNILRVLGPGLVTGAADDDPSGIATYSQVGAQFGFSLGWVLPFSYPLMAVTQEVSARIGCVTGRGIAQNLRRHYPRAALRAAVLMLLVANIANLGADLGAMAAALQLLVGGHFLLHVVGFGALCVVLEVYLSYARYAAVLKFLTLSLLAYAAVVFAVHVPWGQALRGALVPAFAFDGDHAMALVALLGTTISPYLFFWQAAQEVEEEQRRGAKPLADAPETAPAELRRVRTDTWLGMGYSNLISLFIVFATAATLHAAGVTVIDTAAQAAEALRPIAGKLTFAVFACGIVGTGLLAVPVLAGSAAYAVCETFDWPEGLDRKLKDARAFYAVIAAATVIGMVLNFIGLSPIKALYWCAVLNGVLAAPLMAAMLLIASNPRIMGRFVLPRAMKLGGWLATSVMAAASVGLFVL